MRDATSIGAGALRAARSKRAARAAQPEQLQAPGLYRIWSVLWPRFLGMLGISAVVRFVLMPVLRREGLRSQAAALVDADDTAGAEEVLRELVATSDSAADRRTLGLVLNTLERPAEALRLFELAWALTPADGAAQRLLRGTAGTVVKAHSSWLADASEEAYALRALLRISPADAAAYAQLGGALQRAGDPVEAAAALRHAVALEPSRRRASLLCSSSSSSSSIKYVIHT